MGILWFHIFIMQEFSLYIDKERFVLLCCSHFTYMIAAASSLAVIYSSVNIVAIVF